MKNSNDIQRGTSALVKAAEKASSAVENFGSAVRDADPEMAAHSDALRRLGISA
jgi:hypothetical protein